ncbi:M10 family metallopeptidase C-terminal domain-containing protein [Pararhizobium capsulatum]|uniref:M10 family metallopeptidase C-terminal domain-containing protein n=1 Tax=Pararhizobium capsulatum TaxID=34014 RepID=UPI00351FB549
MLVIVTTGQRCLCARRRLRHGHRCRWYLLYGNNSANAIGGGNGNDILIGYGGNDTLTGGDGGDRFDFRSALSATTNVDKISDFNVAADAIRLENAIFKALTVPGTLTSGAFASNSTGLPPTAAIASSTKRTLANSTMMPMAASLVVVCTSPLCAPT